MWAGAINIVHVQSNWLDSSNSSDNVQVIRE